MTRYVFCDTDYETFKERMKEYPDGIKYKGRIDVCDYNLLVNDVFSDIGDDMLGFEFVESFGHIGNVFFVLTIHGNFLYSFGPSAKYDGFISVRDGLCRIKEENIMNAYLYAFNRNAFIVEFIPIS